MKLSTRLGLALAIFSLVPSILLGVLTYVRGRDQILETQRSHLMLTSLSKESEYARWLETSVDKLVVLAQRPLVKEYTNALLSAGSEQQNGESYKQILLTDHLIPNLATESYEELNLIRAWDGVIIVSTNETQVGKIRWSDPFFLNALEQPYVDDFRFSIIENQMTLHISVPVRNQRGEVIAVLAGHMDLVVLDEIFYLAREFVIGEHSYLVTPTYTFVAGLPVENQQSVFNLARNPGTESCIDGNTGFGAYADHRGKPVISAFLWMDDYNLCVLTELEEEVALMPILELRNQVVLISLVTSLVLGIVGIFLAKTFTDPLQQLVDGANKIGAGDLSYRLLSKRTDELGTLANSFDLMTKNLEDSRREAEALYRQTRQLADELELRVMERTQALVDSEQRFRLALVSAPLPIMIHAEDGTVLMVNEAWTRASGYEAKDIPTLADWAKLAFQEIATPLPHQVYDVDEPVDEGEKVINTKDQKELLWMVRSASLGSDLDGKQVAITTAIDITQRKQFEQMILLERDLSDGLINSLPGVFYLFDQEGRFSRWNQNLLKVTEYSEKEFAFLHPVDLFRGDDVPRIQKAIASAFEEGQATIEAHFWTKNARAIPYLFTASRVHYEGEPRVIGTGFDITERVVAENNLKEAIRRLERSNKELEMFAYIASHDLQEPLRMVASYLQLLERRYREQLDEDAQVYINYAVDGANRMKVLINDLLDYSRINTKAMSAAQVDCERLIGGILDLLQVRMQEAQAQISHSTLPTVFGDEKQLRLVFQNLIDNAIKFRAEHPLTIRIEADIRGDFWEFSIQDNGIGIDPLYFDRIFVIFQRLHTRDKYEGTGIGLAISQRIIHRHGGRMWVKSKPKNGATFYFTLPIPRRNSDD